MRIDIMVDIETLGKSSDSTIFQIAAMAFDIKTGEIYSRFNQVSDISLDENIRVTGDTLKWWLDTDKELLHQLLNKGQGTSEEMLLDFKDWIYKLNLTVVNGQTASKERYNDVYLWGNGILFDNKMLQTQIEALGEKYPIFFKNDRDVRTIVDLAAAKLGLSEKELKKRFERPDLKKHDAYDDVIYQIELVRGCYQELIG